MRAGVIGYGEVGSAIASLYRKRGHGDPVVSDPPLGLAGDLAPCDVIHVAVPAQVVHEVVTDRRRHPLYIVHSSVPVGTCRALAGHGLRVVHAPVRGSHPGLVRSLETFVMPVGGPPDSAGVVSSEHITAADVLRRLGISVDLWGAWEETELAKLLCTLRLGLDVLWMRHVQHLCAAHGAAFDRVYTQWTSDYSDGFLKMGMWQLRRTILDLVPGPIGGGGVLQNAKMLAEQSEFAAFVLDEGARDWRPA